MPDRQRKLLKLQNTLRLQHTPNHSKVSKETKIQVILSAQIPPKIPFR